MAKKRSRPQKPSQPNPDRGDRGTNSPIRINPVREDTGGGTKKSG